MAMVKATDYVYLSVFLRATETEMLTRDRWRRAAEAAGAAEACKILTECGYPDMTDMTDTDIEAVLTERRRYFFEDVQEQSPEKEAAELFRLKYDYHNIKTLIKAEGSYVDTSGILSPCGVVPPETMRLACAENKLTDLPDSLAEALTEAKGLFHRTGDPQTTDILLDKLYYADLLKRSENLSDGFAQGYVKQCIDVANLRTAVRCIRCGYSQPVLRSSLIEGGEFQPDTVAAESVSPERFEQLYRNTPLEAAASMGAKSMGGGSLTAMERECDNVLIRYMTDAQQYPYGLPTVVSFLASLEGEITAVRMIVIGKRNGLSNEALLERLRERYD